MSKPVVAIVGRPNVGKSTLFNKLIGQRLSIVDDTPGVTRDRIYGECEWKDRKFTVVDTGGIEPDSKDIILTQMRMQAQLAIDAADVIVLVTDIRTGLVATDSDVAAMLLKSGRPVILCVNKCDTCLLYTSTCRWKRVCRTASRPRRCPAAAGWFPRARKRR